MIKATCDVCGRSGKPEQIHGINSNYKIAGVHDMCEKCRDMANKYLFRTLAAAKVLAKKKTVDYIMRMCAQYKGDKI